jgi:ribosomal protein S18 acetylase RimI-like enzyme
MVSVNRVPPSDEHAAISTIVAAFRTDPVAQWFYPDPQRYLEVFPGFVKVFAGAAFAHDSAYATEDYSAAALWLPPGAHPDEEALAAIVEKTLPEPRQAAACALLARMEHHHPDEPHWYLPMIGVVPDKQRHGYGSGLLKHALTRCDTAGMLAYLEASSSQSVPLYERHGFEVVGRIQAGSSPALFPMVRKPRRFENRKSDSLAPQTLTNPQASAG